MKHEVMEKRDTGQKIDCVGEAEARRMLLVVKTSQRGNEGEKCLRQ